MEAISRGLEDVNIKWTRLTSIDGERGILRYAGYSVDDLINGGASAEEVQYLFLHGELPREQQLREFASRVERGYRVPPHALSAISSLPRSSDAVALQMAAFASLAASERFSWDKSTDRDVAASLVGNMLTITANAYRHILGLPFVEPDPRGGYARSFLRAAMGREPTEDEARAMNAALILYMDHEVPASTTAGLVVVSTLSDMYSGVIGALAALRGPLHGGAAEAAIAQFAEIGSEDAVEEWFRENIASGRRRLMGFGHRVYRTYDPRARIFKGLAERLAPRNPEALRYYRIALRLEELGIAHFGRKGIYPNTDFWSGIVYASMGFPLRNNIYTALFALSRITGWLAHFIEYVEEQHRLIRPRAVYTGPGERKFVPLPQRS
ncbi:MAG: citrate synthase [Conexivisphaera sp.]